jgi:hypothetical protein
MKKLRPLSCLMLALPVLVSVCAAPVPHPDRPDRLVETRDGFSVEYSPGQEAWMEMGFAAMRTEVAKPATPPAALVPVRPPGPAVPGSARYLQENREVILAAIARQIGLPKATALQGRVFDTFLGYYKLASELMWATAREIPATLTARHLAIWHRDDLVARMRAGAKIEGMMYDPATDSGQFRLNFNVDSSILGNRLRDIQAEIDAQKLKHQFEFGEGSYSATVSLGMAPDNPKKPAETTAAKADDLAAIISGTVFPIIYRGDPAASPTRKDFDYLPSSMSAARAAFDQQVADYRNPNMVTVILHEAAETGLVENLIGSRDRRWLCDGTANYVAWRVSRDLMGSDFATRVYDLDMQLRQHAGQLPKINLVAWPAVEHQKKEEADTELNRAHYTFATRAMFLLAKRHGENALAQLWSDVARTPKKKVSAKTFATAYRKRFKANLDALITEAEKSPIPAEIASVIVKP